MMKKLLLSFFLFCISITVHSQMYINDPQSWWGEAPAAIENVDIEVRTIGAYAETAIAFDVKLVDDNYFYGVQQLEFVFDFKLKDGVVMNDSWLWIDEYISVGEVYEQGEGTQIYESIVDRQQDPSILTQLTSTDYNLKIYPMRWDSTRRVRLSYLEPMEYLGKKAFARLPMELLKHSELSPENISITIYDDGNNLSNGLNSDDWTLLEEGADFKAYQNNFVFDPESHEDILVSYSPQNDEADYFLNTYDSGDEAYYQLVYYPDIQTENIRENRMVVFDYDSFTSEDSFEEVKEKLKSALLEMEAQDYFIVCYSGFITRFSSDEWMPATAQNIEDVLANINLSSAIMESRLSTILPEALNRVEELNLEAEVVLLSPNNEYYLEEKAKAFLNNIMDFYNQMQTDVEISVVDYAREKLHQNIDGLSYYGNDYVYENLVDETGGIYYSKFTGDDVYLSLYSLFAPATLHTDQYEFQLTVEDGFVYADFDNLKSEIEIGGERPIISTGKYVGDGLFDVKFSAKAGDEIYSDTKKLDVNAPTGLGAMASKIWHSENIKSLQHSGDYEYIREVIKTSIYERLLSLHTVFLCLEPGLESISGNNNNEGGDVIISTIEEEPDSKVNLSVFPNPFVERLNIEFFIDEATADEEVIVTILDSRGQLIERITKTKGLVNGMNAVVWEPMNDLVDGMYVVQLAIGERMYNQSVLHVRS